MSKKESRVTQMIIIKLPPHREYKLLISTCQKGKKTHFEFILKVLVVFKNKIRNPTSTFKQICVLVEDRIDIHKMRPGVKDFVVGNINYRG